MIMIPICPDKTLWNSFTANGSIFIAAPQIQFFVGPIDLVDFIAFKGGVHNIPELTNLQSRIFDVSKLPPIT